MPLFPFVSPNTPSILVYLIMVLMTFSIGAVGMVGWLIYDTFIYPKRRARRRLESTRLEMMEREATAKVLHLRQKEREAFLAQLDDILMQNYKEISYDFE